MIISTNIYAILQACPKFSNAHRVMHHKTTATQKKTTRIMPSKITKIKSERKKSSAKNKGVKVSANEKIIVNQHAMKDIADTLCESVSVAIEDRCVIKLLKYFNLKAKDMLSY